MRDELERLLEEEAESAEAVAESLTGKVFPVPAAWEQRAGTEGVEEAASAVGREALAERAGETTGEPSARPERERAAVRRGQSVERSALFREDGGAAAARQNAGRVYQTLLKAQRAARSRSDMTAAGLRQPLERTVSPLGQGQEAAGVDRAFQRDARRYDGGFTWQ